MNFYKKIGWFAFVLCFWMLGCSSLHVETNATFDWSHITTIEIVPPQSDSWNLLPKINEELASMGIKLSGKTDQADLQMHFFVQEGPDIDREGNVYNRLESLHVQFVDPYNEKTVAVADYFYADTDNEPAVGVKAVFAEMREKFAGQQDEQTATPVQESEQQSAEATVAIKEQPYVQNAIPSETSLETSATELKQSVPTSEEKDPDEIAPLTRSPWLPRFKSWGFENWEQETAEDNGY